jgi:psiF repeat-containing protein
MRRMLIALSLIALLAAPAGALTSQQEKMKSCNAEATKESLSGDARQKFMSTCLKADSGGGTKLTSQQQKMKDCNASATSQNLKGTARQDFMSSCLKH